MKDNGSCPNCGESMNGDEIPGLRGRRTDLRIGLRVSYVHRAYVILWRCPFCGFGWPRIDEGPLHDAAVAHLKSDQQKRYEVPA